MRASQLPFPSLKNRFPLSNIISYIDGKIFNGNVPGGLPDCAPGKCPATAEISPIKCSSDPAMFFNNGYPMVCAEGFTCDAAAADAGEGNPCRAAEEEAGGYE